MAVLPQDDESDEDEEEEDEDDDESWQEPKFMREFGYSFTNYNSRRPSTS